MESKDVIRILDAAVLARGSAPEFIRSDNGPEFIALAVQDWIARRGFATLYHERPHSSLDYQTPVEFAQRSLAAASATLRQPPGCALPTNPNPENQQKLS
jgi:transposase InsO family protein